MKIIKRLFRFEDQTSKMFENDTKSVILDSGLFNERYYLSTYNEVHHQSIAALEHYCLYGIKEDRRPNSSFDPVWYKENYQDVKNSDMYPFIHYICYGKSEGRFQNEEEAKVNTNNIQFNDLTDEELHEYHIINSYGLDWSQYASRNQHRLMSSDEIVDYIKSWKAYEPMIPGQFDTDFYLDIYPDIEKAGVNPLVHYLTVGKEEGRQAFLNQDNIIAGNKVYVPERETIVFVSHESSPSGAPLLGYNIADKLIEKYNIIHIVIKKSDIHKSFLENCDLMLCGIENSPYTDAYVFMKYILKSREIKCVICNSAVTSQVLSAAYTLEIPSLLLIHEFHDYVKPAGTVMGTVFQADNIIVPATIVQDSVRQELIEYSNNKNIPKNMHIIPQGKLPYIPEGYGDNDNIKDLCKKLKIDSPDDAQIVVGSGWVQIRKGVDLFIATAKYIKQKYKGKCKFVWVGGGYEPETDMTYSVWLRRELEYSGLGDDFIFLEHQKNLDTIFSVSDVFCLTSRMDPFPNVVIDALEADLHIACFDNATGSSEFLEKYNANCTVVDYLDTYQLADGIIKYFEKSKKNILQKPAAANRTNKRKTAVVNSVKQAVSSKGVNQKLVAEKLDFDQYINEVEKLINDSVAFHKKVSVIVDELLQSNEFNADYYETTGTVEERCRKYVDASLKGIRLQNPKPGFSQLKWLHENSPQNPYVVPLYEALKLQKTTTHEVQIVPYQAKDKIGFFYAVHLHLFYLDLAEEFADYFRNLPGKFDLLITIVNEEDREKAEKIFAVCGANEVKIMYVKNIGRDIGPLFFRLKDVILANNYEVIGHFHSKKSFDVVDGIGDRWRKYLTETLIGDATVAKSVVGVFKDKRVGLVFPDDRHIMDSGENKVYIDELCKMMDLPEVTETALFPLGNMFWARVDAVKDFFALDPDTVLKEEPLPYDGSYMHAIERITPAVVEKNGYSYKTVYREGVTW